MARRRVGRNYPLEWKTDTVNTASAAVTNGEFDLDLLPDEIAEIYIIDTSISFANIPDAANDDVEGRMYLSMDPDADDTPATDANLEDLEVFYTHNYHVQQEIGAAGQSTLVLSDHKTLQFPEKSPILIGTNFAQVVMGDAAVAVDFHTTVYFKRRKASGVDLANILLKRR